MGFFDKLNLGRGTGANNQSGTAKPASSSTAWAQPASPPSSTAPVHRDASGGAVAKVSGATAFLLRAADNVVANVAKGNTGSGALVRASSGTLSFLSKAKKTCEGLFAPKIYMGFDATASRSRTWTAAQGMMDQLVDYMHDAGEAKPMIRVSYFNGYGNFDALDWSDDPSVIKKWMRKVDCITGTTQIRRIFEDAKREIEKGKEISSITYVGDHMDGDSKKNLMSQAAFFAEKGVPVNILHEVSAKDAADQPVAGYGNEATAADAFQSICELTGGTYQAFLAGDYKDMTDCATVFAAKTYQNHAQSVGMVSSNVVEKVRVDTTLSPRAKELARNLLALTR